MSNHKQSCISFTAPQFTAEDQQREQESLTDADRTAIQEKLLGWMALRRETPQFLEKGVQQLEHALSEIPMTQKEAYQRALERAPEVVQDETNPVAFLRAEDYQPEAAAQRMVKYWSIRYTIYGEEAFRPLIEVAYSAEENKEDPFPTDAYVPLPPDVMGRTVMFTSNGGKRSPTTALRRTFESFHFLAHGNEVAQRHGCVLLSDGRNNDPKYFDRKRFRKIWELIRYAVPVRIWAVHVCFAAFKSAARILQPSILWMYGRHLRLHRKVHYGSSKNLCLSLQDYGFKAAGLTAGLGGTYLPETME